MSDRIAVARAASRLAATIVFLIGVTAGCRSLPVNATTAGFAYLIVVLSIASTWGLREGCAT